MHETLRARSAREMSMPDRASGARDNLMSVMIVDDDEAVLKSLAIVLRNKFRVQTFANPEDAVAQARAEPPDIIVLDIKMPKRDGFWVFHEIRKFNKGVPIIYNSAFQEMLSEEDLRASYEAFGFVLKNGSLMQIMSMLNAAAATYTKPTV